MNKKIIVKTKVIWKDKKNKLLKKPVVSQHFYRGLSKTC
jgi:hypothetical protein